MRSPLIIVEQQPDDVVRQACIDRGMPIAEYDHIKYNCGETSALLAVLAFVPQRHDSEPGGGCGCS